MPAAAQLSVSFCGWMGVGAARGSGRGMFFCAGHGEMYGAIGESTCVRRAQLFFGSGGCGTTQRAAAAAIPEILVYQTAFDQHSAKPGLGLNRDLILCARTGRNRILVEEERQRTKDYWVARGASWRRDERKKC